jgi:hypothetical protein
MIIESYTLQQNDAVDQKKKIEVAPSTEKASESRNM